MGTWGPHAWDSDDAADFFGDALAGAPVDRALDAALADPTNIGAVRAAAYLLGVLGVSYMWPGDLDRLQAHISRAHTLLTSFLDPQTEPGQNFRELCGHLPDHIALVRAEIEALERNLRPPAA